MGKAAPKFDAVIDGVRVRIYATRTEYEAVFNDDDRDDMSAEVYVYPKLGDPETWARQARTHYQGPTNV